jgi:catabolite regulation protein CreA
VLEQPQFQHGVGRSLIGRSETIIRIVDNNDRMLKNLYLSHSAGYVLP